MKRSRKLFVLALAICMSVSIYVPAYAAEKVNDLKVRLGAPKISVYELHQI